MPRLPAGVTWPMVAAVIAVIFGGMWVSKQVSERQRLLGNLETHAMAHPEDAAIAQVIIECNKRLVVDVEGCGERLVQQFGENVLVQLGKMQMEGAFGRPLGPDGKPVQ